MKNKVFKILTMCFAFLIVLPCICFLTACGCSSSDPTDEKPTEKEFVYEVSEDGKYVYLGSYAQTIKAYDVQIVSETPDENGYYKGSDGEKYIKHTMDIATVHEDEDMPKVFSDCKLNVSSRGIVMQDGRDYYFKVEKMKWRVLYQYSDGTVFLLSDNAIDSVVWQKNIAFTDRRRYYNANEGVPADTYANNYQYSDMRKFLNEDFYEKNFTDAQKALILTTEVDNSEKGFSPSTYSRYECDNTFDKVFLPSYRDLKNQFYGFDELNAKNRLFVNTDYAKAKGAVSLTSEFQQYEKIDYEEYLKEIYQTQSNYSPASVAQILNKMRKTGGVFLRSPGGDDGRYAEACIAGEVAPGVVNSVGVGVVPAIRIKLPMIKEKEYKSFGHFYKNQDDRYMYRTEILDGEAIDVISNSDFALKLKTGTYLIEFGLSGTNAAPDYFAFEVSLCLNDQVIEDTVMHKWGSEFDYTETSLVLQIEEESTLALKIGNSSLVEVLKLTITQTA